MKLFQVSVTLELVMLVKAEDAEEAKVIAIEDWYTELDRSDAEPVIRVEGEIKTREQIPKNWRGDMEPYGQDEFDGETVEEIVDRIEGK